MALGLGLLVSNTLGAPRCSTGVAGGLVHQDRHRTSRRKLALSLIAWAGPVAIVQAAIVSLVTFGVIYFSAKRFGLVPAWPPPWERAVRYAGSPAPLPLAARWAPRSRTCPWRSHSSWWGHRDDFRIAIGRQGPALSGVAGAWIGTSEFAGAAGLAAAQTYGGYAGTIPGIAGHADAA